MDILLEDQGLKFCWISEEKTKVIFRILEVFFWEVLGEFGIFLEVIRGHYWKVFGRQFEVFLGVIYRINTSINTLQIIIKSYIFLYFHIQTYPCF